MKKNISLIKKSIIKELNDEKQFLINTSKTYVNYVNYPRINPWACNYVRDTLHSAG